MSDAAAARSRSTVPILFRLLLALALVGGLLVTFASPAAAADHTERIAAADGVVTTPARVINDSTATNGQALQFATSAAPSPAGFTHPGILVNRAQLDYVKGQILLGAQPWTAAFQKALTLRDYSDRTPHLTDMVLQSNRAVKCNPSNPSNGCVVECGSYSNPDNGCTEENGDAESAYTQALLWYLTGQDVYAESAVAILNGWSLMLKNHTNTNAALQASWAGTNFTRAAEIIHYTYTPAPGKPAFNHARFVTMLNTAFLPAINSGTFANKNGNWELSAIDARMNIAVYTDNRSVFQQALDQWRARVPAYIYISSDGSLPVAPPGGAVVGKSALTCFWLNNASQCSTKTTTFQHGQTQESCRDYEHVGMGLAALFDTNETAQIQGVSLTSEERTRLAAGLEHTTKILNTVTTASGYPADFCIGHGTLVAPTTQPTYEIGYNAMANREDMSLPQTLTTVRRLQAAGGTEVNHMMVWETLTHYNTGTICDPPDASLGSAALTASVPVTGTYRIWARMKPLSSGKGGLRLQVDSKCSRVVEAANLAAGQWSWVSYLSSDPASMITAAMSDGDHLLTVTGKTPGLAVDTFLLTDDLNCVPTGDGSDCDSAPPPDTTAPSVPGGLTVSAISSSRLTLSWDASADNVGVHHYVVRRDGNVIAQLSTPTYRDTGLAPSMTYSYTVSAVDAAGNASSETEPFLASTTEPLDTAPPTVPDGLVADSVTDTRIDLTWSAATDDVGVDHYVVTRNGSEIAEVASTAFSDTGRSPSTQYDYRVLAVDAADNRSDPSQTLTVTTQARIDATAPTTPTALTVTGSTPSSVSLRWSASSDEVGVTGYDVYRGGVKAGTTTGLTYTDPGLEEGTAYSYTVVAFDGAANRSGSSGAVIATTTRSPDATAPSVPGGFTVTGVTSTTASLRWNASTDNVGVTGYDVFRAGVKRTTTTALTYTDTGLTASTAYSYTVLAFDDAGNRSAASTPVTAVTAAPPGDTTKPSAPATFTAQVTGLGQVTLNWSAATDNVAVTGYRITRGGTLIASPTALTYTDPGLPPNTANTYTVVAVDAAGNVSTAKSATVTTPLDAAPTGAGFAAAYFPNKTLTGPAIGRLDPTLNFSWGSGAPMAGIPADNYSVRWSGRLTPTTSGSYTFYTQGDDGVRLYLNDSLIIDKWVTGNTAGTSSAVSLTAGTGYNLRLEYYENTGSAAVNLQWAGPGIAKQIIPSTRVQSASTGLSAAYFANNSLTGAIGVLRRDNTVNFAWGTAAPVTGIPADNFSVRWTGKVIAPSTASYTFYTESDDAVRLWVNNVLLVDNWTPHTLVTNSGKISLTAGTSYAIRMEYNERTNSATAKLSWAYGTVAKVIIPAGSLRDR